MNASRFIFRSLIHHRRIHAAVALGVAAATAVLTGALLVGDSVRGSLRFLTLDRLGRIELVLASDRFFRQELAAELAADDDFQQYYAGAVPAVLFARGTAESTGKTKSRTSQVTIIGCGADFWNLGTPPRPPAKLPGPEEVVLNRVLADDLGVGVGDEIVLRLPSADQVPGDSPLGKKTGRVQSLTGLKVVAVIAAEGLGRFSLLPSQTTSPNAYVAIESLQDAIDQPGKINAIFVSGHDDGRLRKPGAAQTALAAAERALQPRLADFGFKITRVRRTFSPPEKREQADNQEEIVFDYFSVTTDRMMIEPAAEAAAAKSLLQNSPLAPERRREGPEVRGQPVLTYLANSIRQPDATERESIPYSMISAVDSNATLGPLFDDAGKPIGPLADDEIVLNRWAAEDLKATVGDLIEVVFFEPETVHGELREQTAGFQVAAIVGLTEPTSPYRRNRPNVFDQRPTPANDPDLTPQVAGITDQESMNQWDAPFPVDYSRLRSQDDDYWQNHRTTPKAFVSLAAGQKLWGSRFGRVTSFRIPAPENLPPGSDAEKQFIALLADGFRDELARDPAAFGFAFQPVKQRGLDAASGTTPFDQLFLGLSLFIIAAALMLVALLFRLGIERRANEIGVLLATGLSRRRVGLLLIAEGWLVADAGAILGVAAGIGYAWLMILGLKTWWVGAIGTPFLDLHVGPLSLVIGYAAGMIVSGLTMAWSLRQTRKIAIRRLLAGQASEASDARGGVGMRSRIVAAVCFVLAIGLTAAATQLGGEAQAGSFVGGGAMLLTSLLTVQWRRLKRSGDGGRAEKLTLPRLAARNAGRNPTRSTLTMGLMAAASFLIVAMSSFRLDPSLEGAGGNDLIAESSEPIFANLNTPAGREELLADDAKTLEGSRVLAFRVQAGEDASCNNLYQAAQPRVLGVTPAMIAAYDDPNQTRFSWAASAAATDEDKANPWRLLGDTTPADSPVPVVIDRATAMFSLHLYRGIGEEFSLEYPGGKRLRLKVVGLLANSLLQGSLLVSQADLVRHFPEVSGYRLFLIQTRPATAAELQATREFIAKNGVPPLPEKMLRRKTQAEIAGRVAAVLEDRLGDQGLDVARTDERLRDLLAVQNTYLSTFQSLGLLGLLLGTFGIATVQVRNVLERRGELALLRAAGFRRRRLAGMVMLENIALLLGGLLTGFVAALLAVVPHMFFGGASIPLLDLTLMLGLVLVVGCLSSLASVRTTLRAPLVAALRGD